MATAGKGDLQLSIGASLDELNKVVVQARAAFESLAQSAQNSSRHTSSGARESEKSFSSLGESMKRFAAEERSEGRAAGFFVAELNKIVPASNSVKIGLGALAEILIGGAGVGAALAIVGAGAEMVRDHFEEAKKKSEELAKRMNEVRDAAERSNQELRKHELLKRGMPEGLVGALGSADVKTADEQAAELRDQMRKLRQDYERTVTGSPSGKRLLEQGFPLEEIMKRYPDKVREFQRENQKLVDALNLVESSRSQILGNAAKQDADAAKIRKIASDQTIASMATQIQLLTTYSEAKRLGLEADRAIDALETKKKTARADEIANLDAEIAKTRELYAERIRLARIKAQFATPTSTEDMGQDLSRTSGQVVSDSDAARYLQHAPTFAEQRAMQQPNYGHTSTEYADSFSAAEIGAYTEDQHLAASKAAEDQQKQIQALSASYQQWGAAAGNVIGGLITGHKSLGETMAQVGQMIIQQVVQAAITSITADAARAGAGAAASQSGIPVVGPVLAVAAMGAIMASVMSLLGNVPSAAGGWKVPRDTLAMVHEDERILPARYSRGLDQLVENGGGSPLIGTVVATDAASFGRQLLNRDSDLVRGLEKAARRRRRAGV